MTTIYTIGHSNRTLEQLIAIIDAHGIDMIADIRGGRAGSRTFPHFNKENLIVSLPNAGIEYRHFPNMGGRRSTCKCAGAKLELNSEWRLPAFKNYADYAYYSDDFDNDCKELLRLADIKKVAYMCSEAVPWRCHRSIVTDYMTMVYKANVIHLLSPTQTMIGNPHDFAKLQGNKVIYPKNE